MSAKPRFLVFGGLAVVLVLVGAALAGDLRLNLRKRTQPTPVQKLNRQGVKALEKHDYAKAKRFSTRRTYWIRTTHSP